MNIQILRSSLLALALLMSIPLQSQDTGGPGKLRLKLYLNGIYDRSSDNTYNGILEPGQEYTEKIKDLDIGSFSVALEIGRSENSSHQFELMPFRFTRLETEEKITQEDDRQLLSGGINTIFNSALWYQYNYYFRKGRTFRPYLSPAVQFHGEIEHYSPFVSLSYPYRQLQFGFLLAATPGLDISLGDKTGLDINVPIGLYDFSLHSERIDNPTLQENLRRTTTLEGVLPPGRFMFRIGLVYKI